MTSSRVLILGAKGMLGQELVRAFSDWEVLAWDRHDLDITNADEVARRVVEVRPATIINAAAYNAVDKAEQESDVANRVNGEAVGYLAKAAAEIGATFVQYSSDYVFDGENKEGYREDNTPNPISAYGQSKLFGEQQLFKSQNTNYHRQGGIPLRRDKFQTNFNPQTTDTGFYLIRTSRLFGKEGGGKKSFVDTMLELSKTRDRFELVDEEVASPTYVVDLAVETRKIIDTNQSAGIYHITNSDSCTWYSFAQEIFKQALALGVVKKIPTLVPVSSSKFPRLAKRPAYSQLLTTKLPPLRPWQDALRDYLQSILFSNSRE